MQAEPLRKRAAGDLTCWFSFSTVPVVITELRISSSPPCLLNGTSVDIQCVNFGFPRPKIVFFKGTKQITPGVAPFTNLEHLNVDSVRLITAQQADSGIYVCEARMGGRELIQSQPNTLVFCSKL